LSCVLRLIFLINDDDQARSKLLVSRRMSYIRLPRRSFEELFRCAA